MTSQPHSDRPPLSLRDYEDGIGRRPDIDDLRLMVRENGDDVALKKMLTRGQVLEMVLNTSGPRVRVSVMETAEVLEGPLLAIIDQLVMYDHWDTLRIERLPE